MNSPLANLSLRRRDGGGLDEILVQLAGADGWRENGGGEEEEGGRAKMAGR